MLQGRQAEATVGVVEAEVVVVVEIAAEEEAMTEVVEVAFSSFIQFSLSLPHGYCLLG